MAANVTCMHCKTMPDGLQIRSAVRFVLRRGRPEILGLRVASGFRMALTPESNPGGLMARLRVGGVGPQSASAYVDISDVGWPESVADLEPVPGRCWTTQTVVQCPQGADNLVCTDCAMAELGESWTNFKARTNAGTPKARFYAALDRAQAAPDPVFRRAQQWARRQREQG